VRQTEEPGVRAVSRSPFALLIAAAAASASLSHWAIDVVADYLAPHASFDDIASHGSRGLIAALAIATALAVALRAVQRCFDAANVGDTHVPAAPNWWRLLPFAALTILASVCAVPAMECVDARLAGETVAGLGDTFGGSILLGVSTTVLCASLVATALFGVVRWLLAYRDRIVAAIMSIVRRTRLQTPDSELVRRLRARAVCRPRLAAFARGERAPPRDALASIHFSPRAPRGNPCFTHSLRRVASFQDTSKHQPAHQ